MIEKGKSERIITTDGSFFDDMRAMERKILEDLGDKEALDILDAEAKKREKEDDD